MALVSARLQVLFTATAASACCAPLLPCLLLTIRLQTANVPDLLAASDCEAVQGNQGERAEVSG